MKIRTIAAMIALLVAWTCVAQTASAAILPGLPGDKNCNAACDCTKCCTDNFSTFYRYGITGVNANDWWAWFNAGQPKGIGCDEIALVAWFATAVMCVLGGEEVVPCLGLAWMLYYIDLVLCYNTCNDGICN
jgi:hypothetical protein